MKLTFLLEKFLFPKKLPQSRKVKSAKLHYTGSDKLWQMRVEKSKEWLDLTLFWKEWLDEKPLFWHFHNDNAAKKSASTQHLYSYFICHQLTFSEVQFKPGKVQLPNNLWRIHPNLPQTFSWWHFNQLVNCIHLFSPSPE